MKNFFLPLLMVVAQQIKANFVRQTRHTAAVQEKFLLKLLREYQNTELGRKYQLGEIKTIEEFQARIPILPYSSYEPYIERSAAGETNLLTPDPIVYITLTSGSTGKKKLIPATRRSQNILRNANLVSMGFLNEALRRRGQKFGKVLLTNSAQIWGKTSGGIDYGPASVGVMRMDKHLYEQMFSNPFETLLVGDSLARHYICLMFALRDRNLRGMIANFPMLILRTCHYLEKYAQELIKDIEKGTIATWLELDDGLRQQLESQLSPNHSRAQELREILNREGRLTPKLAWQELAFVGTARGGTSDFYFERFPSYFGDTPVFGAVFSSAESTFSIYPDMDTDSSVLAIETGFFEFIPQNQWHAENPKTLLATEVKPGERYRILVSNYGGFWRYDIGDVIEVVGFYEKAPLIVFRHRLGGLISSTTEKTTESHATQVMQSLQQEFNILLEDFCLTLSENDFPARYLVNIELIPGQALENPQAFIASFDDKLKEANTHYQISRKDTIPAPHLRILAPGSFAILRQRQLARGIPDSQLKFPHITEDREFLAGLKVEREIELRS